MRRVPSLLLSLTILPGLALTAVPAQAASAAPAAQAWPRYQPHLTVGADGQLHTAYFTTPVDPAALTGTVPKVALAGELDTSEATEATPTSSESAADATAARSGGNRYQHGWAPSPTYATRYMTHDHAVEWYGSVPNVNWRGWVASTCHKSGAFISCDWWHTNFCAHYSVDNWTHACKDFTPRSAITGWTYWTGTYRPDDSGGSFNHSTSSGFWVSSSTNGIRAKFRADNHTTNWYGGCSDVVNLGGQGYVWDWRNDCYGSIQ